MIKAGITDYLAAEIKGRSSVELQFLHGSKRGDGMLIILTVKYVIRATESFLAYRIVCMTPECVSEDQGGRVKLAKAHYGGLNQSLNKNFEVSGLIASMEQSNDDFFNIFPRAGLANSNHKNHLCAEFHAGSRAICGGPVYVSDKVGHHNSDLLKKLVLPDGNKFRCQNNALPTGDRLFDGTTMLRIWNLVETNMPHECAASFLKVCVSQNIALSAECHVVEWEQRDRDIYQRTEKFSVYLHKSDNLSIRIPKR
ncbi:hypothetical protein SADUNF_Sadunf10G0111400 [Salix dunnii]|uniref:Uncharacterized protein n=1 Tax=Salix dunnii TaxID=1413687 RepID=A0A835MQT1_9ROSI|nr:hypothetical protein SADUNF_Sadunf10G0111400 [Salix dunnii]